MKPLNLKPWKDRIGPALKAANRKLKQTLDKHLPPDGGKPSIAKPSARLRPLGHVAHAKAAQTCGELRGREHGTRKDRASRSVANPAGRSRTAWLALEAVMSCGVLCLALCGCSRTVETVEINGHHYAILKEGVETKGFCEIEALHVHHFTQWSIPTPAHHGEPWTQVRSCTNCGWSEIHQLVPK